MAEKKKLSQHVDKKILFRARIFAGLSVVFIVILIRDAVLGSISAPGLGLALGAGVAAGVITSRMYHLSWDKDGKKVIGRLDGLGSVVLGFYIAFAIFRKDIVNIFVHGPMAGTVTIAVMAGLFIGQIIGIRNGVKGILRDEGFIS